MADGTVPAHKAYWRKTLTITWLAFFAWAALTVLIGLYPHKLGQLTALYAVLTGCYAWYLSHQDRTHG